MFWAPAFRETEDLLCQIPIVSKIRTLRVTAGIMYSYDFPEQREGQSMLLLQCILFQGLQLEAFELRLDPLITDFDFPDLQHHSQP